MRVDAEFRTLARTGLALLCIGGVLAGCVTAPRRTEPVPPPTTPPTDIASIPDAVPKPEPRSAKGNPPFYTVLGKRYFVLQSAEGYVERGVASWYGPGFHSKYTSNGEVYDMYAMTAAHKTLPLPTYVQVTNLSNGRSVVVRVNDRGPFKEGRIIDLSYTAAAKLDMLRSGTAFVEVRAISAKEPPQTVASAPSALFVQAGAFSSEANATKLVAQLRAEGITNASIRADAVDGRTLYRVRVGPVPSVADFDRTLARLKKLGIEDAHLAAN
ncbi:MAG TPA: septal ring lytic transglycosylase RlpA family protein [Steroidobacteraceae bacterium]|mgnify:CR=1 FL=1